MVATVTFAVTFVVVGVVVESEEGGVPIGQFVFLKRNLL